MIRRLLHLGLLLSLLTAAVAAETNLPPFYQELLTDGAWLQLAGKAWVWQPRTLHADPAWRPYLHGGSWTLHDDNWFWTSEYQWGAIVFHYGRWLEVENLGWLWVPATQWCPAWVDWRLTPTRLGTAAPDPTSMRRLAHPPEPDASLRLRTQAAFSRDQPAPLCHLGLDAAEGLTTTLPS